MNRKLLAAANILVGLFAIGVQIASYAVTRQVIDYISTGMWSGLMIIVCSSFILLDTPKDYWILTFTCLSILMGLIMLVLYSWNLNRFFKVYTTAAICELYAPGLLIDPISCKDFVIVHGLMISLGLCIIIINSAILFDLCRKPLTSRPSYFYKSGPTDIRNTLI